MKLYQLFDIILHTMFKKISLKTFFSLKQAIYRPKILFHMP